MSFLDDIWQTLKSRKTNLNVNPNIQFPKVIPGYRTIPIQSLERKPLKQAINWIDGKISLSDYGQKKIIHFQQNTSLNCLTSNGFFSSFYEAYMTHGDIKVKPDEIWLMIMMWFVKYVNDNAQQLRKAFVSHEGKKKLSVMVRCQGDNMDWSSFFKEMIKKIKENTIGKVTQKLQCNFSCSTQFDQIFSTAAIMCGFKKYFEYEMLGAGCGIVNAHLGGTLQDWQLLIIKLDGLIEYDVDGNLKKYIKGLRPVLQQFVETYKGYAHLQFWNNIYHEREDPTIPAYTVSKKINGWLIKFFTCDSFIIDRPSIDKINVDISFKNIDTLQEKKLTLLGASQGHAIHNLYIYQPQFAYGIIENQPKKKQFVVRKSNGLTLEKMKQRQKGFQVPNASQVQELKKQKSKNQLIKLPSLRVRHVILKQIYGATDKKRMITRPY